MNSLRKRLTYANVTSSLALFLVLAGGSALAASHLGKSSVGSKQLKKNSVTAAKIKKNAVTAAKIKADAIVAAKLKNGSVTGAKVAAGTLTGANLANGSISGAQINAASTPFTQITGRLRSPATVAFGGSPTVTPLGSYTQPAGEDDQYIGGVDVNFPSSCSGKRQAVVLLAENVPADFDLKELNPSQFVGIAFASDKGGSAQTVRGEFVGFAGEGAGALTRLAPNAPVARAFSVIPVDGECETGSEDAISISNLGLDVLGTK